MISFTVSRACPVCTKSGVSAAAAKKCPGPGPNCPTCANFWCGFCKGKGHSIKKCPVLADRKKAAADATAQQRRDVKAAFNAGAFITKGTKRNFGEKTEVVRSPLQRGLAAHVAGPGLPRTTSRYAALFEESLQEEKKAADFPELRKGKVLCAEPKSTSKWATLVKKTPEAVPVPACPVPACPVPMAVRLDRVWSAVQQNKPAPSGKYSWADEEDIGGVLQWDPNDDSSW